MCVAASAVCDAFGRRDDALTQSESGGDYFGKEARWRTLCAGGVPLAGSLTDGVARRGAAGEGGDARVAEQGHCRGAERVRGGERDRETERKTERETERDAHTHGERDTHRDTHTWRETALVWAAVTLRVMDDSSIVMAFCGGGGGSDIVTWNLSELWWWWR